MKTVMKIRNSSKFVSSFSIFGFSLSLLAMILLLGRIFIDEHVFDRFLVTSFYFTTQSNVIIFVVMTAFLFKRSKTKWFRILAIIGLLDIIITGLFFHLFLTSYLSVGFMQQLLHTIIPIFYLIFYFLFIDDIFHVKDLWILLIHPIVFVVSVYTWIHPFFGPILESIMSDLPGSSYVYPFLDPLIYHQNSQSSFLLNLILLTFIIVFISLIIIVVKSRFEHRLKQFETN